MATQGKMDHEEASQMWRGMVQGMRKDACYEEHEELLLKQAVVLDPTGDFRNRALICASGDGNAEEVELMLSIGARVDAYTTTGLTSLHVAAIRGHTHIVNILIAHGADAQAVSSLGAASSEGIHAVLGHCSAEVVLQPKDGVTPLMLAAVNGHLDVVKMLLSCGVDVGVKDTDGRRAVAYASMNGHKDIVRALISHQAASGATSTRPVVDEAPVKRASSMDGGAGGAPCVLAPREVDDALATLLEAECVDGEATIDEVLMSSPELGHNVLLGSETALMSAVVRGEVGVVRELLVKYRCDPNVICAEEGGRTCLMMAASYGDETLVRILLDHGANVHAKDIHGGTAVHLALASPDVIAIPCLELLKEHGADLTATSDEGFTALMLAAYAGRMELVRYLLANGADPTARDKEGRDAIAWAKATSEGREVVGVLSEAANAHMERLATQIEGQASGGAQMHKEKSRKKKHRKKNGKGQGAAGLGEAQAGGGVGGVEVTVDAFDAGVGGGGDGGEEQQLQQVTVALSVASLHGGKVEPAAEEAEAQDSATVVPLSADTDGIQEEAPAVELTEEDMDDAPGLFECPISHTIMRDPVIAQDGYSYERSHIEIWIRKAAEDNVSLRSPMTNGAMEAGLYRNLVLKFQVGEYVQRKLTEEKARLAALAASS